MIEQVVTIIYPPDLVNVPIIYQLIRKFDLSVNILKAELSPQQGWMELQLSGSKAEIEEGIHWLETQGLEIKTGIY